MQNRGKEMYIVALATSSSLGVMCRGDLSFSKQYIAEGMILPGVIT